MIPEKIECKSSRNSTASKFLLKVKPHPQIANSPHL